MDIRYKGIGHKSNIIYNIADDFLKSDITTILCEGTKDENPRPKYKDEIPAHTLSVNQVSRIYDLALGEFPFCTLRPIAWKSAIKEIFWIYQDASNDLNLLNEKYHVSYWNDWNIGDGTIGNRYGAVVRKYNLIDNLIHGLKTNPFGRRHIMDLWQETDLNSSDGLSPCAFLTMWNVRKDNSDNQYYLDLTLIQRSGDMLCASGAGNINEIQYACLLLMISKACGYKAGRFCHFVQNEQIYDRHIDAALELSKIKNYNREEIIEKNPQLKLDLGI